MKRNIFKCAINSTWMVMTTGRIGLHETLQLFYLRPMLYFNFLVSKVESGLLKLLKCLFDIYKMLNKQW